MKLLINKKYLCYGLEDARQVAMTYHLDDEKNDMMVVEHVERLHLAGTPFHTGFVVFCVCKKGEAEFMINNRLHKMSKGSILVSLGDATVTHMTKSEDFVATAIVTSPDFLQESVMSMIPLWPYLLYLIEHPVIKLGEVEMKRIEMNYQLIIDRLAQKDYAYRREATIANLQACYLDVADVLKKRAPLREGVMSRSYGIFDEFVHLVAGQFTVHRDVSWYASRMGLTPKYLSEVVKEVSGRTASQWITEFVITELKSLLVHSDMSIKEMSVELNFKNQSFLGKYFKNVVGVSPLEYRQHH